MGKTNQTPVNGTSGEGTPEKIIQPYVITKGIEEFIATLRAKEIYHGLKLSPAVEELVNDGLWTIKIAVIGDAIEKYDVRINSGIFQFIADSELMSEEGNPDLALEMLELLRGNFCHVDLNSTFQNTLGHVYHALNKREEALACYTKAIEIDPNNSDYYLSRALLKHEMDDPSCDNDMAMSEHLRHLHWENTSSLESGETSEE